MRYETKRIAVIRDGRERRERYWHNEIVVIRYKTEIYTVIYD